MECSAKIVFVGVSHLSLVYASVFSGYAKQTTVFDTEGQLIDELRSGVLRFKEPLLEEELFAPSRDILFTQDTELLEQADIIFVAKDVLTDVSNNSDYSEIYGYFSMFDKLQLSEKPIVIMSQVNPGFCRRLSDTFPKLVYFVETLVFGEAIKRAKNPERLILGLNTADTELDRCLHYLLANFGCKIIKSNYETAELSKISINLFLASSVTLTNYLAEVCENIGGNWHAIEDCLRTDRRIGQYAYLRAGLGLSGGNVERDIQTFQKLSDCFNDITGLTQLWVDINQRRALWPSRIINSKLHLTEKSKVCFLGLAYKKDTNSLKNAPSIVNLSALRCNIVAYDSFVDEGSLPKKIKLVSSIQTAVEHADCVVIFNDNDEFKNLDLGILKSMRGRLVLDPLGICEGKSELSNYDYVKM